MAIASLGNRSGTVETFDDERGLGQVRSADGSLYPFHCTAIADGSRHIEPGRAVRFDVVAGRAGRWEAGAITPV